jgi:hypothetical protein
MRQLAKQICQYNGQKGTDKQVDKCIKSFNGSLTLMQQFAAQRIPHHEK